MGAAWLGRAVAASLVLDPRTWETRRTRAAKNELAESLERSLGTLSWEGLALQSGTARQQTRVGMAFLSWSATLLKEARGREGAQYRKILLLAQRFSINRLRT